MADLENEDITQVIDEWSLLVGQSILHFCDIERITFVILEKLPSEPIDASAINLRFAQRVELILSILSHKDIPSEIAEKMSALLTHAQKLSETRNLIVHNPLYLTGYIDEKGKLQPLIYKKTGKQKSINYEDLEKVTMSIEKLTGELYEAWSECSDYIETRRKLTTVSTPTPRGGFS